MAILDHFPEKLKPRRSQEIVINEIAKVFESGKRIVILEAPVGSGKSAVALTFARSVGKDGAHIITPRKSLQNQYHDDFPDDLVLMKGRNAYPCIIEDTPRTFKPILKMIREGRAPHLPRGADTCSNAPCMGDLAVFKMCTSDRDCPYKLAIEVAQEAPIVVHNLHSFIFQTNFATHFEKRKLLIIDEAHEIEPTIRDFIIKKIHVQKPIAPEQIDALKTIPELIAFLLKDEYVPEETARDRMAKEAKESYQSNKDKYLAQVTGLELNAESLGKGFSVETTVHLLNAQPHSTTIHIIPHNLGNAVETLLFQYADQILLMSGTIYNKDQYCRNIGIHPDQAHFIRVGSSFPKANRPIYAKEDYQVDTSHANWNENFGEMIDKVKKIMAIFGDAKGLIHAPSYYAAEQIVHALKDPRIVHHQAADFLTKLEEFFRMDGNQVFVSPVCQQGVDFKEGRARFQIVLRVPYLNTSSKFVEDKVKNDFSWYNYQALVVFGQQIGRVNRSETDYGATFLMDSRFNKFLAKNRKMIPNWVHEAVHT